MFPTPILLVRPTAAYWHRHCHRDIHRSRLSARICSLYWFSRRCDRAPRYFISRRSPFLLPNCDSCARLVPSCGVGVQNGQRALFRRKDGKAQPATPSGNYPEDQRDMHDIGCSCRCLSEACAEKHDSEDFLNSVRPATRRPNMRPVCTPITEHTMSVPKCQAEQYSSS